MTAITIPSGSPAAGLTRPPAQRGRAVNAQSDRAEHRESRSGALDRPAARSYPAAVPSTPTHMSPEPGCVIHAQISEKDSDARQGQSQGRPPNSRALTPIVESGLPTLRSPEGP